MGWFEVEGIVRDTVLSQAFWIGIALGALAGLGVSAAVRWRQTRATVWMRQYYWQVMLATGIAISILAGWVYLADIAQASRSLVGRLVTDARAPEESTPEDLRHLATAIALLLGTLAAATTLVFQLVKVWINERTTSTAEQGLITDRINKAVEGLGAEKVVKVRERPVTYVLEGKPQEVFTDRIDDWREMLPDGAENAAAGDPESFERTVPNIEVRIGAIYALERIAQDSDRDHVQIMEILTAYVRENAPASTAAVPPDSFADRDAALDWVKASAPPPRADIQTVLKVLGRRTQFQMALEERAEYRLDLSYTNLQRAVLSDLNLSRANLFRSRLDGAHMQRTKAHGANLRYCSAIGTHAQGVEFIGAQLQKSQFTGADLEGGKFHGRANALDADFSLAILNAANLSGSFFKYAEFLCCEELTGIDARDSVFAGADFTGARLESWTFSPNTAFNAKNWKGAALRNINLKRVLVVAKDLELTFADGSVCLSKNVARPEEWSDEYLSPGEYDRRWRELQKRLKCREAKERNPSVPPDGALDVPGAGKE